MKTSLSLLALFTILFYTTISFSQNINMSFNPPPRITKFSVSILQGWAISQTGNDLMQGMINSGLNVRSPLVFNPQTWFWPSYTSGGESYPQRKERPSYTRFQARYDINSKSAFAINWNTALNVLVKGHQRIDEIDNYLNLKSTIKILTVDYIFRTGKGFNGISIGPALAFHKLHPVSTPYDSNLHHHKSTKPGIHLGYALSFFKHSNWILGLNAQYNWFPKDTIYRIQFGNQVKSVYKEHDISLNTLGVGIITGFKF